MHNRNLGYGRNQKTCYREALKMGADIVVMLHTDYQYSPKLITSLVGVVAWGEYDVSLGSRILGVGALEGGMPLYKYISIIRFSRKQSFQVSNRRGVLLYKIFCRSLINKLSAKPEVWTGSAGHIVEVSSAKNGADELYDIQFVREQAGV